MVPGRKPLPCKNLAILVSCLLAAGCAGQVPPGGGEVDSTPPEIVRTVPDTNAVRVATQSLTLEFSEYVNRRTVEESIFISPYVGDLEFDWDGREVTVRFGETLRKSTTYVVNVGTDVTDLRAGNRMAAGFTLAFSTGDSIDQGFIGGRIFDDKPEGVMLFAYRLDLIAADTLDPTRARPDYITQTGSNGRFALSNLTLGSYRVFAVRDQYRNLLYDRQIDDYGVTTADIVLNSTAPRVDGVGFRMTNEDTTRPFLAGVRALDSRRITVRFSESIDSLSFTRAVFSIRDTLKGSPVPIIVAYQDRIQRSVAALLTAAPLDSPAVYRLHVHGIADLAGNRIDSMTAAETFEGLRAPDTLRPRIRVLSMRDSIRNIGTDAIPEILFSDPVRQSGMSAGVRLLDSTRAAIPASLVWTGPASFGIIPGKPLTGKSWYTITVTMDSVRSLLGRGYRDSTFTLRFQTLDLKTTGQISGTVVDALGQKGRGRVVVTAAGIDGSSSHKATVIIDRPGPFRFLQLQEGRYVISGFRDADSSGTYSYGLSSPFVPAERFAVYPDTLRVRARWGVEGVVLRFK